MKAHGTGWNPAYAGVTLKYLVSRRTPHHQVSLKSGRSCHLAYGTINVAL